jgi:hypothetical protein
VEKNWDKWTFGELESMLSHIHEIDDTRRTAFQARLKNFHRLHYPLGFKSEKGKTSYYSPSDFFQMALALELTQLGLPPDRTVNVLVRGMFATCMAVRMAASSLIRAPKGAYTDADAPEQPLPVFVFFDPAALSTLMSGYDYRIAPDLDAATNSYFYGGIDVVRDNISNWTGGDTPRMCTVNITTLIDIITGRLSSIEFRSAFFDQLIVWSTEYTKSRPVEQIADYIWQYLESDFSIEILGQTEDQIVRLVCATLSIDQAIVVPVVKQYLKGIEKKGIEKANDRNS